MQDLLAAIQAFNRARDWEQYHAPKNLAMALAAEAGELLEPFLWLTAQESHGLQKPALAQVREEIGDVLICLINLADKLGLDPIQAAWDKLQRNRIKYPARRVRGKADKYDQYSKPAKPKKNTSHAKAQRHKGKRQKSKTPKQ